MSTLEQHVSTAFPPPPSRTSPGSPFLNDPVESVMQAGTKQPFWSLVVGQVGGLGPWPSSSWACLFRPPQNVRIDPNSLSFNMWKEIPVPFYLSVYFFNIVNPEGIIQGQKPQVQERGPYVYRWGWRGLGWDSGHHPILQMTKLRPLAEGLIQGQSACSNPVLQCLRLGNGCLALPLSRSLTMGKGLCFPVLQCPLL